MSVRDELHLLIDRIDDERALKLLTIGTRLEQSEFDELNGGTEAGIDVDADTLLLLVRPISDNDPFWSKPPLPEDDGPTDMASNKHRYLAEAYGNLHEE